MGIKGNSVRYGTVAVTLHWVSAVAILIMLGTGFSAHFAAAPQKAVLLRSHVPLGMLVLALTLARIAWACVDTRPEAPPGQPRWQAGAARAVHVLLYLVVIVMGSSGIGLMALSGAAAILFSGAPGPLPDFSTFVPMLAHGAAAFVLIGLLGAHVGATFYHQAIRRDRLLSRMGIGSGAQD